MKYKLTDRVRYKGDEAMVTSVKDDDGIMSYKLITDDGYTDNWISESELIPYGLPLKRVCDCGGTKAKTTHSHWCSVNA